MNDTGQPASIRVAASHDWQLVRVQGNIDVEQQLEQGIV